jgi:hypothetical protein
MSLYKELLYVSASNRLQMLQPQPLQLQLLAEGNGSCILYFYFPDQYASGSIDFQPATAKRTVI